MAVRLGRPWMMKLSCGLLKLDITAGGLQQRLSAAENRLIHYAPNPESWRSLRR